jgi:hypothetical protein
LISARWHEPKKEEKMRRESGDFKMKPINDFSEKNFGRKIGRQIGATFDCVLLSR